MTFPKLNSKAPKIPFRATFINLGSVYFKVFSSLSAKQPKEWPNLYLCSTSPAATEKGFITPVLKKGNTTQLNNNMPVSCLPAASNLLEIVVCSSDP